MQVTWLEHLLAERGVHGHIIGAQLVAGDDSTLFLDVETYVPTESGRGLVVFGDGEHYAARERHVLPLGGLVFA